MSSMVKPDLPMQSQTHHPGGILSMFYNTLRQEQSFHRNGFQQITRTGITLFLTLDVITVNTLAGEASYPDSVRGLLNSVTEAAKTLRPPASPKLTWIKYLRSLAAWFQWGPTPKADI
ncbi:hypothetical protein K435DRAFT_937810 [Dendrothele bispora CBS 962.96]|uniref:Uncharacterized protein n=1 Tax=Dendrothele bispora (strain CBS 962.96) TaxID=1314807 RepID=A0A4S8KZ01_DENBC|nr:hypothetical protein K435DRAFT_937810 [Dendrothele bispora CBS 962.96]